MMMYLLNFVLCSGLLLAVYHLFLQNERMYRFNRFYLLFSLMFSLAVPSITIATKTETVPRAYQQAMYQVLEPADKQNIPATATQQTSALSAADYLPLILIGLYSLVTTVLIARFVINLYRISREVTKNEAVAHQDAQLILTDADVTPHSFLKYVFINRNDYRDGTIAPEIICHEQTHVRQLHSLDVILVEVFQAIFWFNPFIPFYRKAIQLNHEFLADEAVITNYDDTPAYQYLLLAKASQAHSLQLTSQFNYLTTKKRLIMMTKITSAKMAWGKKLALLPVLVATLFLFGNTTSAQQTKKVKEVKIDPARAEEVRIDEPVINTKLAPPATKPAPQDVIDNYAAILKPYGLPPGPENFKDGKLSAKRMIEMPKISATDQEKLMVLYNQMDKAQRDDQWMKFVTGAPPMRKVTPNAGQFENFKDPAKYGVWIDGKKVDNKKLNDYKASDFDHYFISNLYGAAKSKTYHQQLDLMTKAYYADYHEKAKAKEHQYFVWINIPAKYIPKPKVDQVRFPKPKVDQVKFPPKPKVDQVKFPKPKAAKVAEVQ